MASTVTLTYQFFHLFKKSLFILVMFSIYAALLGVTNSETIE